MKISPVFENQASKEAKNEYEKIKDALEITYLPLFFSYIGGFPEYLKYLTDQIVPNLLNSKFLSLIQEAKDEIYSLIKSGLVKSEEIEEWLERYKNSPSFYNFQLDLDKIFIVNLKLTFIFIALREALKGWAIAAKKLPATNQSSDKQESSTSKDKDFIFEDTLVLTSRRNEEKSSSIKVNTSTIEKDLLPRYIFLCEQDYNQLIKKEQFLLIRVGIEKLILSTLPLMPEKIVSPINIFYELTEKYQEFPDLLYLMYEYFPTLAVQKMMFSGFMKN